MNDISTLKLLLLLCTLEYTFHKSNFTVDPKESKNPG